MKKMTKRMAVLLICVLAISCFAACGDDSEGGSKATATIGTAATPATPETETIEGKFVSKNVLLNDGTEMTLEAYLKKMIVDTGIAEEGEEFQQMFDTLFSQMSITYTFQKDGTVVLEMMGLEEKAAYQLKGKDGTITSEDEDEPEKFVYDSEKNTITIKDDEVSLVLVKE